MWEDSPICIKIKHLCHQICFLMIWIMLRACESSASRTHHFGKEMGLPKQNVEKNENFQFPSLVNICGFFHIFGQFGPPFGHREPRHWPQPWFPPLNPCQPAGSSPPLDGVGDPQKGGKTYKICQKLLFCKALALQNGSFWVPVAVRCILEYCSRVGGGFFLGFLWVLVVFGWFSVVFWWFLGGFYQFLSGFIRFW